MSGIGIPKDAKYIGGRPHIELTDEFHQDEPLGYLVKCHDDTMCEYQLFGDYHEAHGFAAIQEQDYLDENGESTDFDIYPLYASHAVHHG